MWHLWGLPQWLVAVQVQCKHYCKILSEDWQSNPWFHCFLWNGKPPFGQDKTCSTEYLAPHPHVDGLCRGWQLYRRASASSWKAPLRSAKPNSSIGRDVSHEEALFIERGPWTVWGCVKDVQHAMYKLLWNIATVVKRSSQRLSPPSAMLQDLCIKWNIQKQ